MKKFAIILCALLALMFIDLQAEPKAYDIITYSTKIGDEKFVFSYAYGYEDANEFYVQKGKKAKKIYNVDWDFYKDKEEINHFRLIHNKTGEYLIIDFKESDYNNDVIPKELPFTIYDAKGIVIITGILKKNKGRQ